MRIISTQVTLANRAFEFYVSGCNPPHCEKCFNPETWDFDNGKIVDNKYFERVEEELDGFEDLIDRFYVLGGEPLHQDMDDLEKLLKWIKNTFQKEIWLFTRKSLEEVPKNILELCDYIKCGRYLPEQHGESIHHGVILSSTNQKIYKHGVDY